eukprot:jgi/Orpsp1_1/1190696/evm.model.d7180000080595.2
MKNIIITTIIQNNISNIISFEMIRSTPMARIDTEWAFLLGMNDIPQSTKDSIELCTEFDYKKIKENGYTISLTDDFNTLVQKEYCDRIVTIIRQGGFYKSWDRRYSIFNMSISFLNNRSYLLTFPLNNPFLYEGQQLQNNRKRPTTKIDNYICSVYPRTTLPVLGDQTKLKFFGLRSLFGPN